ncbi:hypothetical protein JHD46_07055, partial [Sulfurimonas sp. SAG-AH-194-C20]|nr:hypothetical protein [Sulfurimonas sp. SAG-AH-194-C20]
MAENVAKVLSVDGTFYIKEDDGSLTELTKNSLVPQDAVVVGADGNNAIDSIIFSLGDGSDLVLLGNNTQSFDSSLIDIAFSEDETVTSFQSMQDFVASSDSDLFDELTDTSNVNTDDIETAANDEDTSSDNGDSAEFAEIENEQEAINVELTENDTQTQTSDEIATKDETVLNIDQLNVDAELAILINTAN